MAAVEGIASLSSSDEDILQSVADDYASILTTEANKEQQALNDTVEDILSRLEDFLGTSDMIRSDVKMSLNLTLDQIHCKCKQIEKQFERIDRLEAFVAMVKSNVNFWEEAVDKAESDMGAVGSLMKAFNSFSVPFLSNKPKSPPPANVLPRFEPAAIFRTEDYFGGPQANPEIEANNTSFQLENNLPYPTTINCEDNHNPSTTTDIQSNDQKSMPTELSHSNTDSLPELKLNDQVTETLPAN